MSKLSIPRICKTCKSEFLAQPSQVLIGNGNFCSRACVNKSRIVHPSIRFWKMVLKTGKAPSHIPEIGQCWSWLGDTDNYGYGHIFVDGKMMKAHRFSWIIHFGAIPRIFHVCHHCDNPPCVRPEHLFLGTDMDNMRDCIEKGRYVAPPRHYGTRMNRETVDAVKKLRKEGASYETIHKSLGISRTAAWNLIVRFS